MEQKNNKKQLGQFFTTNYKYILQNMKIPDYINTIIEPFCGNADLLNFIDKKLYKIESYDIDPKKDFIIKRDTIKNPPDYKNKFIITNPPYLARNKSTDKTLFDKYNVNDLYKCFIKEIITNKSLGGIIIIPLNFWSSIRTSDILLRKLFLEVYQVSIINIFEETVFNDTTYTICSFQFTLKKSSKNNKIKIYIYPSKKIIYTTLDHTNNFIIGGSIYNLPSTCKFKISRLTSKNNNKYKTNILVKCIDDNKDNQISLKFVDDKDIYIDNTPNLSARTYATLVIEPKISKNTQKVLINKFNTFLLDKRNKFHSLFLTNYRESKDIARKRISFDLVYKICLYLLDNMKFKNKKIVS